MKFTSFVQSAKETARGLLNTGKEYVEEFPVRVERFYEEHEQTIKTTTSVAGATVVAMTLAPAITTKAAILVGSGVCLSVGFAIGKKVNNAIDAYLLMHNKKAMSHLMSNLGVSEDLMNNLNSMLQNIKVPAPEKV